MSNAATTEGGMGQVGPGANHYERKRRFAGGCTDSHECEARVSDNWEYLTRTALALFVCEEVVTSHGERT